MLEIQVIFTLKTCSAILNNIMLRIATRKMKVKSYYLLFISSIFFLYLLNESPELPPEP